MSQTIAQQRGLAFAPIPFATISFLSSSYVVHYLLFRERQKLQRLYHRLVLAMNFALLPLNFTYAWSTFAVPKGTPNYVGASGTMNTCVAQGFIRLMLTMTVPVYYASLSVQAFVGIKNNFREEKYRWIEKYFHFLAWIVPAALCSVVVATENFNPSGSGCNITKAPLGCKDDPDVPCERGQDIDMFETIMGIGIAVLYFVIPPSVTASMYCWIKKLQKKVEESRGMQQLREAARKRMMHQIAIQISLYLFSFWFTFVTPTIVTVHHLVTGESWFNLVIFGNCLFALQGFVMAMVYFALQRLGRPKAEAVPTPSPRRGGDRLTVGDIRASVQRKSLLGPEEAEAAEQRFSFNIFDGTPDADSPWARYFDQQDDDGDDSEKINAAGGVPNDDREEAALIRQESSHGPRESASTLYHSARETVTSYFSTRGTLSYTARGTNMTTPMMNDEYDSDGEMA